MALKPIFISPGRFDILSPTHLYVRSTLTHRRTHSLWLCFFLLFCETSEEDAGCEHLRTIIRLGISLTAVISRQCSTLTLFLHSLQDGDTSDFTYRYIIGWTPRLFTCSRQIGWECCIRFLLEQPMVHWPRSFTPSSSLSCIYSLFLFPSAVVP